jgi:hypothetical protein
LTPEVEEGEDTLEEIFDFSTTERTLLQPIGDSQARFAEIVLQHAQPFPGEDDAQTEKRFAIYEISPTEHVIMDSRTFEDVVVLSRDLQDPTFPLGLWYAKQLAVARGKDPDKLPHGEHYLVKLGDAYGIMIILILRAAGNQSSDLNIDISESGTDSCLVHYGMESRALSKLSLKDRSVDLVAWAKSKFNSPNEDYEFTDISSSQMLSMSSDDDLDIPALQSCSDTESEISDLQSISDSDSEADDDESNPSYFPDDLNETFDDCMHLFKDISRTGNITMKRQSSQLGDLVAEGAKALLEFLQPYPGGELVPIDDPRRDQARFEVLRVSKNNYLIWDQYFGEITVLPERLLREHNFELAAWYAVRIGRQLGIPRFGKPKPIHRIPIDDLLALGSETYMSELGRHEPDALRVDRVLPLTCGRTGRHSSDYLIMESIRVMTRCKYSI